MRDFRFRARRTGARKLQYGHRWHWLSDHLWPRYAWQSDEREPGRAGDPSIWIRQSVADDLGNDARSRYGFLRLQRGQFAFKPGAPGAEPSQRFCDGYKQLFLRRAASAYATVLLRWQDADCELRLR